MSGINYRKLVLEAQRATPAPSKTLRQDVREVVFFEVFKSMLRTAEIEHGIAMEGIRREQKTANFARVYDGLRNIRAPRYWTDRATSHLLAVMGGKFKGRRARKVKKA